MRNLTTESSASKLYQDAEQYILSLITGPPSPDPETPPETIRQRAVERLDQTRAFLDHLGNPQNAYRSIHIGGTSGKGSTATFIASILTSAGFRTGLHVSPYLQVATEKLVVDNRLASATRYRDLVQNIAEKAEAWESAGNPPLTYGEFWVALTFYYFAEENVDVGVIEVGAGGRFDLTNVIEPEVVAITSIGLDHVVTLGDTVEEIAWHKAGIIKPGVRAITAVGEAGPLAVIQAEATEVGADLIRVEPGKDFRLESTSAKGTRFVDNLSGKTFQVALPGQFQAANAATAIAVTRAFDAEAATNDAIETGLAAARFPGRMEVVQSEPLVMLDGAHNPQKIEGLAADIREITGNRRVIAVFGVLDSKNHSGMIDALAPHVDVLVATSPKVYAKPAVNAEEIARYARRVIDEVHVESDPLAAVARALDLASNDDAVIVTGSLYLVGNVRERWFPTEQILSQGTMWPSDRD
ncbi:MAG: folylpolyglutamate synthase/dihydrofolate synthase family protein [Thermomicrobiales bacterium]